jgi:hypothetical protein
MNPLLSTLQACIPLLPESFRTEHARLFADEHLARLADCFTAYLTKGPPITRPLPHFAAETTPLLFDSFDFFRGPLVGWLRASDRAAPTVLEPLANAIVAAGCDHLLLLLGQRRTSASWTDARAIPPVRATLLAAATQRHVPREELTVAGRALSKHVVRAGEEDFWPPVQGTTAEKNTAALAILERILNETTWWNVFGHFAHEVVYEARVPTGHGARWGHDGTQFIGFLGPFDEEKCPSLTTPEG